MPVHCRFIGFAMLQVPYDPSHWIEKATAVAAGAGAAAAALALWPCVKHLAGAKGVSSRGLAAGVLLTLAPAAVQLLLCNISRFCLR